MLVAAVLLVTALAIAAYLRQGPRKLTDKDTIIVADFANTTGDPVFDETLRQGLTIQLEQSPFLSLMSEARIRRTLRLMRRTADAPLTPELAREVCERNGGTASLEGSVASLGREYVLGLRAKDCASGDVLYDKQVQVRRKEDVLNALTQIARAFRSRAGESLASVRRHDTPLIEATTPSLEALKAYSASIKVGYRGGGCAASVPFGRRAVELDPQFAMAHSHLGRCYSNLGESELAAESATKAYELRDRASDREKFYIVLNYDRQVLGNLVKAQQAGELWIQTYPRDPVSYGSLFGLIYQGQGKYKESIEAAQKAIALDPDMAPSYVALGFANLYQERIAEAGDAIRRASERNLDTPDLLLLQYYVAFLKGDKAGMEAAAARARGRAGAEDSMYHSQALALARSGHVELARTMSRRAVDLAQQAGQRERAATYQIGAAVWEALFGNASAAKQSAWEALAGFAWKRRGIRRRVGAGLGGRLRPIAGSCEGARTALARGYLCEVQLSASASWVI